MDLKRRTAKFIPTAQYGADITALRRIRCQLATDLTDYTGNCSAAVLTIFVPYSFIDLMSGKYPTWMTSQICKDCKFMVSQSDESTVAIYGLLLQPNFKTREGKCRLRWRWCKVDKLWLIRNKLHNFVDYMFFMIRNGQNQKFTHFAHILSPYTL